MSGSGQSFPARIEFFSVNVGFAFFNRTAAPDWPFGKTPKRMHAVVHHDYACHCHVDAEIHWNLDSIIAAPDHFR